MHQKAPDELRGRQPHGLLLLLMLIPVVFPEKGYFRIVHRHQALRFSAFALAQLIGDRDAPYDPFTVAPAFLKQVRDAIAKTP